MESNELKTSKLDLDIEDLHQYPSDDALEAMVSIDHLECKCNMTAMSKK